MENKQDTSQLKSYTKSYRRRQRRKEAAALQKQITKVVSQLSVVSVQCQDILSEENIKIANENTVPSESQKSVNEISTQQDTSQQSFENKFKKLSSNISEDKKNPHVIPKGEILEPEEASSISRSKRRRIRKKALLSAEVGDTQGENIENKERQLCSDASKTGVKPSLHCICSQEECISGKGCLTPPPKNSTSDNKNLVSASSNSFEKSIVIQRIANNCQNSCIDAEKIGIVEEENNKVKKDSNVAQELNLITNEKNKLNYMCDTLDSNKNNQGSGNFGKASVQGLLEFKEDCDSDKGSKVSDLRSKVDISDNSPNTSSNLDVDFGEEQNQSSFVFQHTGIYSSHTSKIHPEINSKCRSAVTENSKKVVGVESAEGEMNKHEKIDKQNSEHGSTKKNEMPRENNDKAVSEIVAEDLVQKLTLKACEIGVKEGSEKSREQVKAEREARKMAKMLKKQKEKAPDVKETTEANVCLLPEKGEMIEEKAGGKNSVTKSDPVTKPIQNDESSDDKKSKAELRAERRAKQEAQRAMKAAASVSSIPLQSKAKTVESARVLENKVPDLKDTSVKAKMARREQGAKLLSRLGLEESRSQKWRQNTLQDTQSIHPAIVQLGTRFTDRIISGSNARCIAFVQAIKKAIQDYQTPPQKELGRDLEARLLAPSLAYLETQRPHAVSVSNATRFLKWQLTQLQPLQHCSSEKKSVLPDEEVKHNLVEGLDSYIWEKIEVAERAVCDTLRDKIKDGDVILTYGCSYLLQQIFIGAKKAGTKFKVVVVDGRPWREGREMLRCLVSVGIPCSYVLLSAASSVMRQVNKVLLGAHALLSNGYVMSRVGVSQVALLASAHNVPVLVACETHKFCERVQSDSFVYNEMGEPDGLAQLLGGEDGPLSEWRTLPSLSLLNLSYDVTPPELVTAVATELAVLPCTSVPVVLRVRPTEPVTSRH